MCVCQAEILLQTQKILPVKGPYSDQAVNGYCYAFVEVLQEQACVFLQFSNNSFLKKSDSVRTMPGLSDRRPCIAE